MHSALFVAKIPTQIHDWEEFAVITERELAKHKGVTRLAENVWLLDLTQSVQALGVLSWSATRKGIEFGLIPFAAAPVWLPAAFDPKPK